MRSEQTVTVLVVEDDPMVVEMIQGRLERSKYNVVGKAADGLEGLELAQDLRPDVVLMDIAMPGMDGVEATRRLQELCPTPVVMLTAYESPDLVEQASQAGAGAYLVKPPEMRTIDRAITIAMARFSDMMELKHLNAELRARNSELQAALSQVKTLTGLLPICSHCKKIRDDAGYWQDIADYIAEHSEARLSHSMCPDCAMHVSPEFFAELDAKNRTVLRSMLGLGWVAAEVIAHRANMSYSETLQHLEYMVQIRQIDELEVEGQRYFRTE